MISQLEKDIYNKHLAISRSSQGKPFKLRKDFSNLSEDKIIILGKLKKFFMNYPNVSIDYFFEAPYKIYEDSDYKDLEFYTTQKAKKIYSEYMKLMYRENPDDDSAIERIKQSYKFLYSFCKERGLTFETYPSYSEGNLPIYVEHLKNHKINFYTLHSLGVNVNLEKRLLDFIFSDFYKTYRETKNKFYNSKRMKQISKKAKETLNQKLKQYEEVR